MLKQLVVFRFLRPYETTASVTKCIWSQLYCDRMTCEAVINSLAIVILF